MRNDAEHHDKPGDYNQRIGRELYNKDKGQEHPQRYSYRGQGQNQKKWDEGNYFHTGPSPRGAQDRNRDAESGHHYTGNRPAPYQSDRGTYQTGHYGSRSESPYRNESQYLNHGYRGPGSGSEQPYRSQMGRGSQPGNYNESPTSQDSLWREGPGTRSRYKEDDYRYGSGTHNWYSEGRYSPDVEPENQDKRGFFKRMRDTWDDIMQSDNPDYEPHNTYDPERRAEQLSTRQRYGGESFRDRSFDRGYESGPRWADETDSGNDDYYKDADRNQRNRR
ncbi:hypothetical protein [Pontibacter amylolyticus]|uniref:SWFGD domain-containing protein n=1 Tax=Pontibacter amylolyticus TaxID=1424080 RepID=A0ABQ1W1G2_9BACT|nr:hypothetical protein [Pontibacter amylolyticus]GGG08069.1 hypothetical protein GCM10011323_10790 [Pontibacter amylolyticus]